MARTIIPLENEYIKRRTRQTLHDVIHMCHNDKNAIVYEYVLCKRCWFIIIIVIIIVRACVVLVLNGVMVLEMFSFCQKSCVLITTTKYEYN